MQPHLTPLTGHAETSRIYASLSALHLFPLAFFLTGGPQMKWI